MKKADIAAGVIGMGFSAAAFAITLGFKKFKNVPVGPEFFPRWIAVGLFICSAALVIQALRRKPAPDQPAPTISPLNRGIQRLLIGGAGIWAYVFCWERVGFPIITPIALFGLMFLLGLRRFPVMIIFSLVGTAVIFTAFKVLLHIDMPLGFLETFF